MRTRAPIYVAALAVAVTALTLTVSLTPSLWFVNGVPLHVALDTTVALSASFAALLVFGRLRAEVRLDSLILLSGLAVQAGSNLFYSAIPIAVGGGGSIYFGIWAPLAGTVTGSALLALAALLPARRLRASGRSVTLAVCGSALALFAIAAAVEALQHALPASHAASPTTSPASVLVGSVPLLAGHAAAAVFFAIAALGFLGKGTRRGDEFASWVGAGCLLLAFARTEYLLFPSAYPHWFYLGDLLRLGGYLLLVTGGVRELGGYWRRLAEVAVLEERRRIARDLHDGLAQELAYLAAETRGELAAVAHRALDESRRAIAALTRPVDEPVARTLAQAAEEIGHRWGIRVQLELADDVEVGADAREALLRIVREAVTNAARHARAGTVRVALSGGERVRIRIADDGCGFDPDAASGGHGIVSMRERAAALGGALVIRSQPGAGTEVEVIA